MDAPGVGRIGGYIKEQRETAKLSLRRLAQEAGVSNPYLSQVERGLRKPSAEILQQLAKALRISAEQLYVQAGLLEDKGASLAVESAVLSDAAINERQKRVLLDIYSSFLTENAFSSEAAPTVTAPPKRSRSAAATSPKKRAASKPSVKQQHASSPAAPTVKSRSVRRTTRRAASSTNTTR